MSSWNKILGSVYGGNYEGNRLMTDLEWVVYDILGSSVYRKFKKLLLEHNTEEQCQQVMKVLIIINELVTKYEQYRDYKDNKVIISEFETIKAGIVFYSEQLQQIGDLCEFLTSDYSLFRRLSAYAVEITKTYSH